MKLYSAKVEAVAIEYIVNGGTIESIVKKYNTTYQTVKKIIKELKLDEKREKYQKKVLFKSLERCAVKQSEIVAKSTDILNIHIKKLHKRQSLMKGDKTLSTNDIRDVMAILAIVSKENRLDNDKATEIVSGVKVSMPDSFFPILNKNVVAIENPQKPKEEENEIIVEDAIIKEDPVENFELGLEEPNVKVNVHPETLRSPLG